MNAPTDWVSAIAILAAGLVLGLLFFFFFSRRKTPQMLGGEPDLERKDLEARRDALIAQLRELEGDPKPELAEQRRRLEVETAAVLRQLDDAGGALSAAPAPAGASEPVPSMNPALKGFLWGAGSFAALFGLAWFVMSSATPREEGGSPTGGMPGQAQQAAPQNPMIAGLEAAVAKDPANLQLRNDLAQAYLESDNLMGVFEQTKVVLERTPDDSRALTLQGLVRMAMGEADLATSMLQKATSIDPKNLDGWVALAWVFAQQGKMKEAESMIAEAARQSPPDKARLDQIFAEMKSQAESAAAQPAAAAAGGGLPAGHPPVDGAGPAQAAAAQGGPAAGMARPAAPADGRSIRLTLDLDAGAKTRTGIVFVVARSPQGGPPVAVKRLLATQFPLTLDFGSADSMMGQPLPDRFRLEARLDSDGDAATKPATDPAATQDDVALGAVVTLALK